MDTPGCTWLLLLLLPLLLLPLQLFNNMSNNVSLMYLIRGPGVDEFPEIGLFSMEDHQSGKIYVHRPVDREVTPSFMVYFDAVDRSTGRVVDESLIFNIRIRDVNDHAPQFPEEEFNTAPWFTLITRASDCGEPPLSSTATIHVHVEEGNNHMPTFTEDHYKIQISEGHVEWGLLYLPVQDQDSPFTPAWRTQFNISDGNEEGHFDIVADSETNQGVLNVVKPLDYETQAAHSLVIVVENEEPLFSCKEGQMRPLRKAMASTVVTVWVVDANDPPAFHPRTFIVSEEDGARPGIQLGDFNATDPDRPTDSQIRYELVHDPANWVTVDEKSGVVTTKRQIDRESPHVNGSFYTIIVHAVDNGLPPLTGTGTLMLFLSDVNDNAPTLLPHSQHLVVCEFAGSKALLLEAEDADLDPYSAPFTFDLDTTQGDVEDTWMLRTKQGEGHSVELIMLKSLPPGDYLVPLFVGRQTGPHPEADSPPALFSLLRCYYAFGPKRHGDFIPGDSGHQTLIVYNEESKASSAQMQPAELDQMFPLSFNRAVAGAKPGVKGGGMFFEPRGMKNRSSTPVCPNHVVPLCPLQLMEERVAERLSQKLQHVDVLEGNAGHLPHVYREEGECEEAESLSSLSFLEQDLSLSCWTAWAQTLLHLKQYVLHQRFLHKCV